MAYNFSSSLPRVIVLGTLDNSAAVSDFEEELIPTFCPHMPLLTAWGPEKKVLFVGRNAFNSIYNGENTLASDSIYYTHQTELYNRMLAQGGQIIGAERIMPDDAKSATMRLSLEITESNIVQYQRLPDGRFLLVNGAKVPVTPSANIPGYKIRWVLTEVDEDFGTAPVTAIGGVLSDINVPLETEVNQSIVFPIVDFEMRFRGARGNNIGFRLWAPTTISSFSQDEDLVERLGSMVYRIAPIQRTDSLSSPTIINTMLGTAYSDFTFKRDTLDRKTRQKYALEETFLKSYESNNPANFTGYGPFARIKVYHDSIATVLESIKVNEESHGTLTEDGDAHSINFLTGVNVRGVPYYSFEVEGVSQGGIVFTERTNLYGIGGSDGTLTRATADAVYDGLVNRAYTNFTNGEVPYMDDAQHPFSTIIDTGFTLETKEQLFKILNRPDCFVVLGTQVAGEPLNTPEEDSSIGLALRNISRSYIDSETYNTPVYKAIILKNGGKLFDTEYDKYVPMGSMFLAIKSSAYMGNASGFWSQRNIFGRGDQNIVTMFYDHNVVYADVNAKKADWDLGLCHAQYFDTTNIHYPSFQTVYDDNTSILSSFFNMAAICSVTRTGMRAWRTFVGDDVTPNEAFTKEVDDWIRVAADPSRYNNRLDITPRSFYTNLDMEVGYSYHTEISTDGQSGKNVKNLTIIAGRREFTQAAA